jgi:phosphonate transport system substrate-binding protein
MTTRVIAWIAALTIAACALPCAAQNPDLVFAVTEGVTYQATDKEIHDKFSSLAEYLGKALGRRVRLVVIPGYDDLRTAMGKQEVDVAFVHPAHVAIAEIKAGRYKAVAWTARFTDYSVSLLQNGDSPLKSLADLNGHTLVTPDPDSITAVMVRAMFHAENLVATTRHDPTATTVRVITTRYQDAVPFYLQNGFAQAAATASPSVVKSWIEQNGGKVLAKSRGIPIKQIVVSTKMSADLQDRVRDAFITLSQSKAGEAILESVGYKGFVAPNRAAEDAAIAWLGL